MPLTRSDVSRSVLFRPWAARPLALLSLIALGLALMPAAHADVLELKDGRLVEGVVLEDGANYMVTDRYGVAVVPVANVKTWHKVPSVDALVADHVAKLDEDDADGRMALATWLKGIGRTEEAKALAAFVLETLEPENAHAHKMLGHIRHRGAWVTPDEAKIAEGYEKHGDRWYTPAEWRNLQDADKKAAEDAALVAAQRKFREDVNRAVRLMMSPDPKVREQGHALLLALAREHDNDKLIELGKRVAEHVEKVQELRKRAAAAAALSPSARGMVMGEIRATMTKLKRPIQVFDTPLASNLGGSPVRIQLPELEVVSVRTFGAIPAEVK